MAVRDILGEAGAFATKLDDFSVRAVQQDMAELVESSIADLRHAVVEAATGVGKTFAYTVPAILSGGKTIISTGSRHLQDQLYLHDLPVVADVLGVTLHAALLKGRANYLCLYRLSQLEKRLPRLHGDIHHEFLIVKDWSRHTQSGDISEVSALNEDAAIWPLVTSSRDHCSTNTCNHKTCFVVKARREAQEADIVVVNHHLFFADLVLKEEGFGEILPSANIFILDEAHQLPETASRFFGKSCSSRQLLDFSRELLAAAVVEAGDVTELKDLARKLDTHVRQFRLSLLSADTRKPWQTILDTTSSKEKFHHLLLVIDELCQLLSDNAERSETLENLCKRILLIHDVAKGFESANAEAIQWYETRSTGFLLHETPFEIAPILKEHMSRYHAAWVFTSATLSIGGSFDHYIKQMGLDQPKTALLDSPFDFQNHSRLYIPQHLPLPNDKEHTKRLINEVVPLIHELNGRTLLLFTSFRAVNTAADLLLADKKIPRHCSVLVQGDAPRMELIEKFRYAPQTSKGAILLATSGFWEGIDIKGEALQLVVIDKLPFASPDDPVLQARLKAIEKQGFNAFSYYQIPKAVMSLKQGAGRLIRGYHDKGLLLIGDPRVKKKFYGRLFLNSLPKMPEVSSLSEARIFLQSLGEVRV